MPKLDIATASREQLAARIAELEAAKGNGKLTLKVSDKGGVSVYGLGRFPVTLYKSQWVKLLAHVEAIGEFLQDNDSQLAEKS